MSHHLAGVAEVASMLGVSRQRVDQLAAEHADFPRPEAELAAGRIWSRAAIEAWITNQGQRRPGRRAGPVAAWDRMTDRARRALALAQGEARAQLHNYLGCEHLIVGLAAEGTGLASKVLARFEVGAPEARSTLEALLARGAGEPADGLPFTPRLRKALVEAETAALELGHTFLGTEHLLLGVLRQGDNVGCRLLAAAGVDLFELRAAVLRELDSSSGPGSLTLERIADELERIRTRLELLEAKR